MSITITTIIKFKQFKNFTALLPLYTSTTTSYLTSLYKVNSLFLVLLKLKSTSSLLLTVGKQGNNLQIANLLKSFTVLRSTLLNISTFYKLLNTLGTEDRKYYRRTIATGASNYDMRYLFLYYQHFIQNTKLGVSKYFQLYYQNNLFFIKFFILKYLQSFFKINSFFLNLQKTPLTVFETKVYYSILLKKIKFLRFLQEVDFSIKAFLNLVIVSLYSKDLVLLKNGIKLIIEKLHFKKHRRFLYNLKLLLKLLSFVFFKQFKCLGLYLRIKGKIGVGGNLKKRKFIFKLGSFSFTKKSQKMNYVKDSIRTYSGVLGFESYLSYK